MRIRVPCHRLYSEACCPSPAAIRRLGQATSIGAPSRTPAAEEPTGEDLPGGTKLTASRVYTQNCLRDGGAFERA